MEPVVTQEKNQVEAEMQNPRRQALTIPGGIERGHWTLLWVSVRIGKVTLQ
jgi:hypothetical protein